MTKTGAGERHAGDTLAGQLGKVRIKGLQMRLWPYLGGTGLRVYNFGNTGGTQIAKALVFGCPGPS